MRVASHLQMSKQQCQSSMTSTEFLDWIAYLDRDLNAFHREDYYLANIARLIEASMLKDPKKAKVKDHILKFEHEKVKEPKSIEEAAKSAKRFWLPWAGLSPEK